MRNIPRAWFPRTRPSGRRLCTGFVWAVLGLLALLLAILVSCGIIPGFAGGGQP